LVRAHRREHFGSPRVVFDTLTREGEIVGIENGHSAWYNYNTLDLFSKNRTVLAFFSLTQPLNRDILVSRE
jgi:hypothetical protein